MLAPEYRDLNYDFRHLFANVIWGNSQVFLPISLVMIGGWFIDRETTHDALKNYGAGIHVKAAGSEAGDYGDAFCGVWCVQCRCDPSDRGDCGT